MKTVLITGVSGFVGSNLVAYFKGQKEIQLVGHSRKSNADIKLLPDLRASTLDDFKIDVVIHLAGIAHDLSNNYKADDYYRVNFEATRKLVDEVLASRVSKFIFVSSIKAAADVSPTPLDESVKPNPVTAYGKSKLKAEEYIQLKTWGKRSFYIFRPAMMHGRGNKGNLNLLYRFAKLGIPFPFGAFHNQRSFHSIENFCHAMQLIIGNEIESGVYHLADEGFLSTTQLYELISSVVAKTPRVWNLPVSLVRALAFAVGKKSMLSKLTEDMMVSNKKITTALAHPLPVGLREGLEKTIRSFDEN